MATGAYLYVFFVFLVYMLAVLYPMGGQHCCVDLRVFWQPGSVIIGVELP